MKKLKIFLKILFPVLAICALSFIIFNSFEIKASIVEKENKVGEVVVNVAQSVSDKTVSKSDVSFLVAKTGHVIEFAVFVLFTALSYRANFHKIKPFFFQIMFIGLLLAVIDEFIQLYSSGRGSSARDILIDLIGITGGLLFSLLIEKLYNKFINKKKN